MHNDDEKRKPMGDEEYQYPNEEYVTETTPTEEREPKKRMNFIVHLIQNNKRVTVVVLVVIIALIAFKIMRGRNKIQPVVKSHPVVQQSAPRLVAQTQPSPELINQLNALKQSADENQAQISQLQNQLTDMGTQLRQSNSTQEQLNQSMSVLVQELKQLANKTQKQPVKKIKKAALPIRPIVFHLKAIVPGRAWIVSNDGLSESVSVGDTIARYGTVKVVDANRGMVLTSSGKVIGYGENDR